jgi:hypothetical protein
MTLFAPGGDISEEILPYCALVSSFPQWFAVMKRDTPAAKGFGRGYGWSVASFRSDGALTILAA